MARGKKEPGYDPQWAEAKRVCRLNQEEIRMAKALGMTPRSLMKNVPAPRERWKQPVKAWIRELYAKRFAQEAAGPRKRPAESPDAWLEPVVNEAPDPGLWDEYVALCASSR